MLWLQLPKPVWSPVDIWKEVPAREDKKEAVKFGIAQMQQLEGRWPNQPRKEILLRYEIVYS